MGTTAGTSSDRRARTRDLIDKWLQERQEVLVQFCQLAGVEPFVPNKSNKLLLKDFCQLLMDYMAFAHFEIYERIGRGEERREEVRKVAENIYPRLVEATEVAVAFNDKYDLSSHEQSLDHLHRDLSILGEELALRIEIEDDLIAKLKG